jgi:hypothetical protein
VKESILMPVSPNNMSNVGIRSIPKISFNIPQSPRQLNEFGVHSFQNTRTSASAVNLISHKSQQSAGLYSPKL